MGRSRKRDQIASLITSDLKRKNATKRHATGADVLKAKMNIDGRQNVANINNTASMEREQVGQTGSTYRKNLSIAADKKIQGMQGVNRLAVQKSKNKGSLAAVESRNEGNIDYENTVSWNAYKAKEDEQMYKTSQQVALPPVSQVFNYSEEDSNTDDNLGIETVEQQRKRKRDAGVVVMP